MVSSNCNFNRAGMRGSGSRGADLSAFSGLPSSASRGDRPCSGVFSGRLACFSSVSAIDLDSRTLGNAHFLTVVAFTHELEPDPRRFAVLWIGERHVGQVDRRFLGNNATFLLGALALVAFDPIDAADQDATVVAAHLDHLAGAALVAARDHDHRVALFYFRSHHSTSGASEMIFM